MATTAQHTSLYNTVQLETVLDTMAGKTAALLSGKKKILVVGVQRRGAPLADMLTSRLHSDFNLQKPTRLDLKVSRYADDLQLLHPETALTETPEQRSLDLSDTCVLVVDDVLYHGHSLLRAVEYLASKGAQQILTAVLVDRGVTLLPVHADITGLRLDVAPPDIIECHVPPYEDDFCIVLRQPQAEDAG